MTPSLYPSLRLLLSTPDALIPDAAARLGNPSWESAPRRILIVRLSPFKDVARSSTHLLLFSECRSSLPEAFLDFAFFPDRGDRELLEERGLSWYYGLASGHPASDFDLVMVSLSFSLELVNLPYLFSTSGLALLAGERAAAREAGCASPLVVLGGSSAATAASLASPEGDSLVDAFFFGEGEGAIGELATILSERREAPRSRLERAGLVEGFRLPRAGGRFEAMRRIARPAPLPLVEYPILNSEESSTARLQISAGCPGLCSFCLEGWDRRPYRELSLDAILAAARELRYRSGADTLEVYSFNFNTHAEIFDLLFELNRIFLRVNFMSQRVDAIASTRGLLRAELAADKRSFTLGIEGISRRMRAYYRKGLSDEGIASAIDELLRAKGVRELKLFYIVSGLENEADLAEFASFASSLGRRKGAEAPGLRILASAGYLVRLPGTPLQYAPLALDEAPLSRIASALGSICASSGIELRLATHFDEYCVDQVLSLAGGRLLPWYGSVTRKGLCYDGSLSLGTWPSLESFARGALIIDEAFLGEKASSWPPPLSFCDDAVLRSHYEEARRFEDRSPCLGAGCAGCGACDEDSDRAAIGGHEARAMAGEAYIERLSRLMAAKAAFPSVLVAVDLPASLAGGLARISLVLAPARAFREIAQSRRGYIRG